MTDNDRPRYEEEREAAFQDYLAIVRHQGESGSGPDIGAFAFEPPTTAALAQD